MAERAGSRLQLSASCGGLTLYPDLFTIERKGLEALRSNRTGILITPDTAKKYGWHIGDRIPLTSTTLQANGSGTWTFDIVGTVTDHEPGESTMMMQTIRERTPELAVLKTLGFGNPILFLLVAGEALLVCTAASLAGLALALIPFPLAGKFLPGLSMPIVVVEYGIVGAMLVALISVSLPGLRAARLNIVDALAGR